MAIEQLRTVADYYAYVDSLPPESPKTELINGRIVVAARPVIRHARYLRDILEAINVYIRTHHLAGEVFPEIEIVLDEHTILVPDILYTETNSPLSRLASERLYGAPEWVCEILSPSTQANDEQDKYLAYLKAGVREYWLVDPDAPAGGRFRLFERVAEGPTSGMPAFQRIEGGPVNSRLFPGIKIDEGLL
ncbi:MAG TPA: Uma2 family endonuclease [Ktedonobacterales bacterium]|jgi:Uma2 family endonuclease